MLGLILLWYVAIATAYAVTTPRWNNPDEPAHFNYIQELAATDRLPVLRPGDWDADLLERLKAAKFPNDQDIAPIRYEAHQPPLYYLIMSGSYRSSAGNTTGVRVLALRILTALIAATTIVATFIAALILLPRRYDIALMAATFVAFLPMNTAISGAINNDGLANAIAAIIVVLLLHVVRNGLDEKWAVGIGFMLGAAVLTKLTLYGLVVLAIGVLVVVEWLWSPRDEDDGRRWWPRTTALAVGACLAVSVWWLIRGGMVYGWLDPLGMARHDAVVVGQPRWAAFDLAAIQQFFGTLSRSFVGQFGWMGIVLPEGIYRFYFGLMALGVVGLAVTAYHHRSLIARAADVPSSAEDLDEETDSEPIIVLLQSATLILVCVVVFLEVVVYNLTFIQAQGRYLFPALAPIAIGLAWGWARLSELIPLPAAIRPTVTRVWLGAIGTVLCLVNVFCLIRYVGPAFRSG
jgi:uncharacterized membrane protein